jgi:CheY-like chemotaxis protein
MNKEAGNPVVTRLESVKLVSAKLESKLKSVKLENAGGGSPKGEVLATLKEAPGQGVAPDAPSEEIAGEMTKVHVLLVEDESLIAEIIDEALTDAGHHVHSVSNAKDALAHLSSGSRVDVLFTDINLPDEMDGAALAECARKSAPDLSVIYASGRWGRLEELRGVPNTRILQKPYSPARACEAVESFVVLRDPPGRGSKAAEELVLAL